MDDQVERAYVSWTRWVSFVMLGTGLATAGWGLFAFGGDGALVVPGAMATAAGGFVAAAGAALAMEALSRRRRRP